MPMKIAILGAHGPTGRLLTGQALAAGHEIAALSRRPDDFPLQHEALEVVGGDATDPAPIDRLVEGADAVLSSIGTPFGKTPVEVYSRAAQLTLDAMKRYEVRRLVVVSSSNVSPDDEPAGTWLFNRFLKPYMTGKLGKTVYDDVRRMEALVTGSDTDWTILRASGLFDRAEVSDYSLTEDHGPGMFTARADLAAAMLGQTADTRFIGRVGHVITTVDNPRLGSMILGSARVK